MMQPQKHFESLNGMKRFVDLFCLVQEFERSTNRIYDVDDISDHGLEQLQLTWCYYLDLTTNAVGSSHSIVLREILSTADLWILRIVQLLRQ